MGRAMIRTGRTQAETNLNEPRCILCTYSTAEQGPAYFSSSYTRQPPPQWRRVTLLAELASTLTLIDGWLDGPV